MKTGFWTTLISATLFGTTPFVFGQDVRIEAGPRDVLWDFENASGIISTSLYNNGNPQIMIAINSLGGTYTNGNAQFGDVSLQGMGRTAFNQQGLTNAYTGLTFSFWLQPHTNASTTFIERSSGGSPGTIVLEVAGPNLHPSFVFGPSSGAAVRSFAGFLLSSGIYNHVAMTFDNGLVTWFKDGVQQNSSNLTLLNPANSVIPAALITGPLASRWTINPRPQYVLDDFAIYGQVLTPDQISFIYDNGLAAFNIPEPSGMMLFAFATMLALTLRKRRLGSRPA